MKKLRLSILSLLLALSAQAQFYTFDSFNETYQEFSDGEELTGIFDEQGSGVYAYSLGKPFSLFDSPVNHDFLQIGKNGYMVTSTSNFGFAVDPFLASLTKRDNSSSVSLKLEPLGSSGESILKIQWKNMGLEGHDAGDFVNFQSWIYLNSQQIEFRYGASKVTDTVAFGDGNEGPQIVVALLTPTFSTVHQIYAVQGSDDNPDALFQNFNQYTGAPAENLVMRFKNSATVGSPELATLPLHAYPNPVADYLNIEGDFSGAEHFTIKDLTGRTLISVDEIGHQRRFNTSTLRSGVYLVEVTGNKVTYQTKLVK